MNKREAFIALAEGKKIKHETILPDLYFFLNSNGVIERSDGSICVDWGLYCNELWKIYNPPKKKVKQKFSAWICPEPNGGIDYTKQYLLFSTLMDTRDVIKRGSFVKIEFELEVEVDE